MSDLFVSCVISAPVDLVWSSVLRSCTSPSWLSGGAPASWIEEIAERVRPLGRGAAPVGLALREAEVEPAERAVSYRLETRTEPVQAMAMTLRLLPVTLSAETFLECRGDWTEGAGTASGLAIPKLERGIRRYFESLRVDAAYHHEVCW